MKNVLYDINKLKNLLTEEDNELKLERLSYDNKLLFIEYFSSDERAVRRAVEIMKKSNTALLTLIGGL